MYTVSATHNSTHLPLAYPVCGGWAEFCAKATSDLRAMFQPWYYPVLRVRYPVRQRSRYRLPTAVDALADPQAHPSEPLCKTQAPIQVNRMSTLFNFSPQKPRYTCQQQDGAPVLHWESETYSETRAKGHHLEACIDFAGRSALHSVYQTGTIRTSVAQKLAVKQTVRRCQMNKLTVVSNAVGISAHAPCRHGQYQNLSPLSEEADSRLHHSGVHDR